MEIEKLFRENLQKYNSYETEEQPEGVGWLKLNVNENAYPPVQEILEDINSALKIKDILRKYPDPVALELRKAVPGAAVDDHFVAHLDVGDILAGLVHDTRGVTATDVKVFLLSLLVAGLDDVDGNAQGGPYVVVVDPRGHDINQDLIVCAFRYIDHFLLERLGRFAESLFANQPGVHLGWDLPYRWCLTDVI